MSIGEASRGGELHLHLAFPLSSGFCLKGLLAIKNGELGTFGTTGFVYAGRNREGDRLKVGLSWGQCVFCRMDQNEIRPEAILFTNDVQVWERIILQRLGDPSEGFEWFDDPDRRLGFLCESGLMRSFWDVEEFLSEEWFSEDRRGER